MVLKSHMVNKILPCLALTHKYTHTHTHTLSYTHTQTGQVIGKVSGSMKTQLIAHDKEVHDIAFTRAGGGRDLFASVGSDGSVRMFALR